jgi:hypothetical protein
MDVDPFRSQANLACKGVYVHSAQKNERGRRGGRRRRRRVPFRRRQQLMVVVVVV